MAQGIRIPFVAEVRQFLAGTKDIEGALEQVEGALDEVAAEGSVATEKLEDDFKRLADSADTSFSQIRRSAKDAGDGVATGLKAGGGRAGEVGSEIGAEFSENIGEGLRSGDLVGTLEETFTSLAGALGPIGIGIGVGAAIMFGVVRGLQDGAKKFNDTFARFLAAVDEQTKTIDFAQTFQDQVTQVGKAFTQSEDDAVRYARGLEKLEKIANDTGIPFEQLVELVSGKLDPALSEADEALLAYIETQKKHIETSKGTANTLTESGKAAKTFADELGLTARAVDETEDATRRNERAQTVFKEATQDTTEAVEEQADEVLSLRDAMTLAAGGTLTLRDAQRQYQGALDDAAESLKEHGKTLDINTEEGRANAEALDAVARAAADEAAAMSEAGAKQDEVNTRLQQGRNDLVKLATQFGMTKPEAEKFAESVLSIPTDVTVVVGFDPAAMQAALANGRVLHDLMLGVKVDAQEAQAAYDALSRSIEIAVSAGTATPGQARAELAGFSRYNSRTK